MAMGAGGGLLTGCIFLFTGRWAKTGAGGGGGRGVKGDVYCGPFIFLLFDRKSLVYVTS